MLFAKQGLMNTMLVVTLNIVLLKVFSLGVTGYMLAVGLSDCICTAYLIIKKRLWGMKSHRRGDLCLLRR